MGMKYVSWYPPPGGFQGTMGSVEGMDIGERVTRRQEGARVRAARGATRAAEGPAASRRQQASSMGRPRPTMLCSEKRSTVQNSILRANQHQHLHASNNTGN
mmetsp:Transcript_26034/g.75951  ORF Transcript_26034/g.75951 Transcript_26034/m.75951 type:complete len:102 (-) Transcript_26034:83-388(-)